jgi:hypothetical protein
MGFSQVPVDRRFPEAREIASLSLTAPSLADSHGLTFESDVDDLGEFDLAAVRLDDAELVWLRAYHDAPEPYATTIIMDSRLKADEALEAVLDAMGLPESAVSWRRPPFEYRFDNGPRIVSIEVEDSFGLNETLHDAISPMAPKGHEPTGLSTYWIDTAIDGIRAGRGSREPARIVSGNATSLLVQGDTVIAESDYELFEPVTVHADCMLQILEAWRERISMRVTRATLPRPADLAGRWTKDPDVEFELREDGTFATRVGDATGAGAWCVITERLVLDGTSDGPPETEVGVLLSGGVFDYTVRDKSLELRPGGPRDMVLVRA